MVISDKDWFDTAIKAKIKGWENLEMTKADEIKDYALRAKAIKITDPAIKKSLVRRFRIKFIV